MIVTTAIQLLIFHKKYTKQYTWKSTGIQPNIEENVDSNEQNSSKDDETADKTADKTYLETVSWIKSFFVLSKLIQIFNRFQMVNSISVFIDMNKKLLDWICFFMEMQFFKVVLVLGFFMSINEVCLNINIFIFSMIIYLFY